MAYHTLISTAELSAHLNDPTWVIVDCRFSLAETERGKTDYLAGHIPGAVYCHLNQDMSGSIRPGITGRHPLPPVEQLVTVFSRWGIGEGIQVVGYDDWPGASGAVAARLWWSLRWLGHLEVAVLDGGWERWLAEGHPERSGVETNPARLFVPQVNPALLANVELVEAWRQESSYRVFDARSADRYRGENETIDPVAGHIPGAYSAPFADNMDTDGRFLPPKKLAQRFNQLFEGVPAENTAFYCGSGVTSAHNLLAVVHAGFNSPRLYVGSWSDWITDPDRPVARGERA